MRSTAPPPVAAWLLERLGRQNDALVGDLLEEYRRGRSAGWYWRQVLSALLVGRSRQIPLTLGLFALYRLGAHIPIPGMHAAALAFPSPQASLTTFALYNLTSDGNLSRVAIFALGIHPFVTAAIIVQVVAFAWRSLARKPEVWRAPIVRYTWYAAIALSLVQGLGLARFLERQSAIFEGLPIVVDPGWSFRLTTVLTLTAGTVALMWISDQITRRRIGNGMLLIVIAGILAGLPPHAVLVTIQQVRVGQLSMLRVLLLLAQLVVIFGIAAFTARGYRKASDYHQLA